MEVPEFFQAPGFCLPEKRQIHYSSSESKPLNAAGDHFAVEDLFDFSNDDAVLTDAAAHSADSSTVTVADASFLPPDAAVGPRNNIADNGNGNGNFSGELGVPYEELAELEWLSNLVEESLSSEDMEKLQLISGHEGRPRKKPILAGSKRSRGSSPVSKKKDDGEGRKCVHCATDKTPQWRTGPMGPKTLCNACGVRYKSGRLVPEYRPASSPTFVLTKHSNSHRKVMELRRQKEMQMPQHNNHYLIHHPDFRHCISSHHF